MGNLSKATQSIIDKLGYSISGNLFYYKDIALNKELSLHDIKILNELKPCAFYCVDHKPFVLFFEEKENVEVMNELHKKIWNSQIPVIIFNNISSIKVYYGNFLKIDKNELELINNQNIDLCDEFSPFSYWNVTNQNFWSTFENQFTKKKLNEILLENIQSVTTTLKGKYNISFATKLILRLIFIRFLIDRGVDLGYKGFSSNIKASQKTLLEISKNKETLYDLFTYLKITFNGNLFDLGDELVDENLSDKVFMLLNEFLSGEYVLSSGQKSLFELYDFNIIPVELISNIYEVLLGKILQTKDKAFYTPIYLVDYILNHTIKPFIKFNNKCKILDPSCGSGIFLVESFRALIEKKIGHQNYVGDDVELNELLIESIYGIDINEEAIDVSIFSLYLTILDYKDPKTLVGFKLPDLKGKNLIVNDFFEEELKEKLINIDFDFIIGNPPWGNIKNGPHVKYCEEKKKPQLNNEISRSFIYKVEEFCSSKTICCFVLPSKLFYNKKNKAIESRKLILSTMCIEKIIELSSVRKLIFKNANAPASIFIFKYDKSNYLKNEIVYISFKPNLFFKLFNILVVEKTDVKYIKQELLYQYDWAWKTILYGSSWDFKIIKDIHEKCITIGQMVKENKFIIGSGIQDNHGTQNSDFLMGKTLIDSNLGVNHYKLNLNKSEKFNKHNIHRSRKKELFDPPYCLISKGINCENYKMRSVYTEKDILFREAIYAIKGRLSQKKLLLNLTGLLNSNFFSYLNLMIGSSVGIEREQRFMDEILNFFPFLYDDRIEKLVLSIQEIKEVKNFPNNDLLKKLEFELENIIFEIFGLKNNIFLDYALNIQIPLVTGNNKERVASKEDLIEYSKPFVDYFENIYKCIKVNIYPNIKKKFSIFELIISDESLEKKIQFKTDINANKELLSKFMISKINDLFYQVNDIINFEENSFFIIKTNEFKNWHPAIAQMDLSEVIDEILSGNREGNHERI